MSATAITYRGDDPAINVKDDCLYTRDPRFEEYVEKLGQPHIDAIYDDIREAFWTHYAPALAREYGYGEIHSDGRCDGWMLVEGTPAFNEADLDYTFRTVAHRVAQENRDQWAKFERAIDALIDGCRDQFWTSLREAVEANENEAAEAHEMACRDIATVGA